MVRTRPTPALGAVRVRARCRVHSCTPLTTHVLALHPPPRRRLIFIYFGLDGTGIDKSPKFDPVLGPLLFISFAALSNTLLTAVLVAILSTTFT